MSLSKSKIISDYVNSLEKLYLKDLFFEILEKDLDNINYNEHIQNSINEKYAPKYDLSNIEYQEEDQEIVDFSISNICNINNIAQLGSESNLKLINEGINIIFGYNGSGKSSYCQILKYFLKSRGYQKPIKNAFSVDSPQSANITVKTNTNIYTYPLINTEHHNFIKNGFLFDSLVQQAYTNSQFSNLKFTLPGIDLILKFREALTKFENEAIHIKSSIKYKPVPDKLLNIDLVSNGIIKCNDINKLYVNYQNINKYFSWTDKEQQEAIKLKAFKESLTNKSKSIKQLNLEKEYILTLINCLVWMYGQTNMIKVNNKTIISESERLEAIKIVLKSNSVDIDSKDWVNMVKSSFSYIQETQQKLSEDEKCPLCKNKLNTEGLKNITNFFNFINNDSNKKIDAAKKYNGNIHKNEKIAQLNSILPKTIPFIKNENDEYSFKEEETISNFINNNLAELLKDFLEGNDINSYNLYNTINLLENFYDNIEERLNELNKPDEHHKTKLEELNNKVMHKHIFNHKSYITEYYENKRYELQLENIKFSKEKRDISTFISQHKGKELLKLYSQHFSSAFEFFDNRINNFNIKMKNRGGEIFLELNIDKELTQPIKINNILSQGEQRAIALCAFYAEAMLINANTPIIFDDPVSSLDHNYRAIIANFILKIVKDNPQRQIIVFTHDTGLRKELTESLDYILLDGNNKKSVEIETRNNISGQTVPSDSQKSRNIKDRIDYFYQSVENLHDMDIHELKNLGEDIFDTIENMLPYTLQVRVNKVSELPKVKFNSSCYTTLTSIQSSITPLRHRTTSEDEVPENFRVKLQHAIPLLYNFYNSLHN